MFQIRALPAEDFAPLHALCDADLAARGACRVTARESPGYPCRVSLAEAAPGERLLLLNHVSQPANSPYRAAHAIYVREGAETAHPAPGEVPEVLRRRLLSARAFDARGMMRDAEVVEGTGLASLLERLLADPETQEVHIHNAKRGCYAARATRA